MKILTVVVSSLLVAVGLGTVFSMIYPRVEISLGLASLFALAALMLVLAIHWTWQAIRR